MKIGEKNHLTVIKKTNIGYTLENNVFLPFNQTEHDYHAGSEVDAFIFLDSKKRLTASLLEPNITVSNPGFVTVKNVKKDLGVFIENNVLKDPLISCDDLPYNYDLWPTIGDTIFCKLKVTQSNLIAKLVSPEEAKTMFKPSKLNKFDKVNAIVIKNGDKGTNLISRDGHSIFVYYKHRRRDYRIGEEVSVTINNCLLDGTYNGTLLESKLKLMKSDADTILDYIERHDGCIEFTAKSSVLDIEKTFNMSKASFKRALGSLYKQRLIYFEDNKTKKVK